MPVVRTPVGYLDIADGAVNRTIFPAFDLTGTSPSKFFAYRIQQGLSADIVINGVNLVGIVSVDISRDVNADGNVGNPATINTTVVTATTVTINVNSNPATSDDAWGVLLTDGDGSVYAAPSVLFIDGGL